MAGVSSTGAEPVWLFDLDNTLHNASHAALPHVSAAMGEYMRVELGLEQDEANELRRRYWRRYGATLLGLVRHHGVDAAHFLHQTHLLPQLEAEVHGHAHDLAALRKLPGRKILLTNAPRVYTLRVLGVLGLTRIFDAVITIEDMWMFGQLRPKPDARMFQRLAARLRVHPSRCILVEDALENQKGARRAGMNTVWVQRWLRRSAWGRTAATRLTTKPGYVDHRVVGVSALGRRFGR